MTEEITPNTDQLTIIGAEAAAWIAFGRGHVVTWDDPEWEVHVIFDEAIHLDDSDTYVGSVYYESGKWYVLRRLTPFVASTTVEPPESYDGEVSAPEIITP